MGAMVVDGVVLAKLDLLAIKTLNEGLPETLLGDCSHKFGHLLLPHCLNVLRVDQL